MSDFNSSLPVRTEDAGDISVRVVDSLVTSQALAIAADGSVKVTDGGGSLTVDGAVSITGPVTVTASHLDIRNLVPADIVTANIKDAAGAAFSATNPLPVVMSSLQPGNEINDFNTGAAVAGNGSSSHVYTVTSGQTMLLSQIETAGTGKMKIEVQIETAPASGVFATKFVRLTNSADLNCSIVLSQKITVPSGTKIKVIRTNKELFAQDVFSTISGTES